MKSIVDYVVEAITTFDKPDKATAAKIDLTKIGKLIEQAGGKDAILVYVFANKQDYTAYKIDTTGQLFESTTNKKSGLMSEWKKIKDIYKVFNKASGRSIETRVSGVSLKDVQGVELWGKKFVDENASEKLAELLGVRSLRIGVNKWNEVFNAMVKA